MNALPVYDNRYTKTKTRTYGNKVNANFRSLNVSEDYIECESFAIIFINSLLVSLITEKRMIDYVGDNLIEANKN